MPRISRYWLLASGLLCVAGAVLHLTIPLGGPAWYSLAGAPPGLIAMAQAKLARPVVSCIIIAGILGVFAAYAFSGSLSIRVVDLHATACGAGSSQGFFGRCLRLAQMR